MKESNEHGYCLYVRNLCDTIYQKTTANKVFKTKHIILQINVLAKPPRPLTIYFLLRNI